MQSEGWVQGTDLLIFDEIHKMPDWKNYLKGVFDTRPEGQKILVMGSARLEIFNEVGDPLAGRFFLHRLFPLSPAECKQLGEDYPIDRFIERGGFPEPFLAEDEVEAKRWRLQYVDSLLKIDVLDFETIHNVRAIRFIFEILRERVGAPISYASIARDLEISPHTVRKYVEVLEALYVIFRVTPFSHNIARSLLKEPKIYFFDTGLVKGDMGAKYENLVALCLLKHVHAKIDYFAEEYSLHYLQTKERHEVDFALVKEKKVEQLIEAKVSNHHYGKGILYFSNKYQFEAVQVTKELKKERRQNGITILSADRYLKDLEL
jgi:predicted AAA+ superfamily ATPase